MQPLKLCNKGNPWQCIGSWYGLKNRSQKALPPAGTILCVSSRIMQTLMRGLIPFMTVDMANRKGYRARFLKASRNHAAGAGRPKKRTKCFRHKSARNIGLASVCLLKIGSSLNCVVVPSGNSELNILCAFAPLWLAVACWLWLRAAQIHNSDTYRIRPNEIERSQKKWSRLSQPIGWWDMGRR